MPIQFDEVNTVTTKDILPEITDNFFKNGPLVGYMKRRFTRRWVGPQIQGNFLYKAQKGGAYAKGQNFDTQRRQTKTGIIFDPRYYEVNITEYLEDILVELAGPNAVFSTVKTDLQEAALTMSAILEIAMFHHGQALPADNRILEINGLEEALTNATQATWAGNTFTSYGGQDRASVGAALNSPTGLVANPSVGQMSFRVLQHSYMTCVIGGEHPVLGITTNTGLGFISENFLPHQLIDATDPEINWPGLKFNGATIVASQYCPGAYGENDADLGNYLASAGETFWWLNPGPQGNDAYMKLFIAQAPLFAMGWTGFKGARDDTKVSGQLLFGGNFMVTAPRLSRALYAITS